MRLLSILIFATIAHAADPRETQVKEAAASYQKCFAGRDMECLFRLLTDDFVLIRPNGDVYDRAGLLTALKDEKIVARSSNWDQSVIRFYGTTALMSVNRRLTLVWVAPDGKSWRLAHSQNTPAPSPAK